MSRTEYQKEWYQRNKEKQKKYNAKWRKDNYTRNRVSKADWKQNNPELNIWSNAKYRAKRKGYEFNLEPSDIVIPTVCPYLGIVLTSYKLKGHLDSHMSLDRIDSSKGYVKGNVEVISYRANAMKQNANKDQLITFAKNVLKKFEYEQDN